MNSSPEQGKFHIKCAIKRVEKGEKTLEEVQELIDFYKSWDNQRKELEQTEDWRQNNMEYDLRATKWICDKAKASDAYAQNLYAAICNNDFIKNDVWPILQGKTWAASWRSAGGIIANMLEEGDYIDWYCSGIRSEMTDEMPDKLHIKNNYVHESHVTDEIREDLLKLGWIVAPSTDD